MTIPALDPDTAARFAALAVRNVSLEYPNHTGHLMQSAEEDVRPSALHPAFYGSYDWHSCVHQHWLLVRLLARVPDLAGADDVRRVLDAHLSADRIAGEAAYLRRPYAGSWERPYGWAWALALAAEVRATVPGSAWDSALAPLADAVTDAFLGWLPRATYPVRHGVHSNSAFGLLLALPAAHTLGRDDLAEAVAEGAHRWYAGDTGYPGAWEPSGEDFLSPALVEAALMAHVLGRTGFAGWLDAFLPTIPESLTTPATVSDRTDPRIVHLDGLNLSRAWCWSLLGAALDAGDERRAVATAARRTHLAASLPHVTSGEYGGEHWLATFALLALEADEPRG